MTVGARWQLPEHRSSCCSEKLASFCDNSKLSSQFQKCSVVTSYALTFFHFILKIEHRDDRGWGKPLISPLHDLSLHPGIKALHYAVQLFEGMKAYRGFDGKIRLFRPDLNMKR